jgi:hypothetical protein
MQRLLLPIAVLALYSSPAQAQQQASGPTDTTVDHDVTSTDVVPFAPPLARVRQEPSLKQRIGRMFIGGVVGGWTGYFASHVAVSDWDDRTGVGSQRATWAAAGLVAGIAAGHLLRGGDGSPPDLRPTMTAARKIITREEILASGAINGNQLIESLRKEWMMPRGINSFRESARGSASGMGGSAQINVVPGADHILVYLDNARLGGTQHLPEINLEYIGKVEWIEPSEATFRWGTGHAHGVILFTTLSATGGSEH